MADDGIEILWWDRVSLYGCEKATLLNPQAYQVWSLYRNKIYLKAQSIHDKSGRKHIKAHQDSPPPRERKSPRSPSQCLLGHLSLSLLVCFGTERKIRKGKQVMEMGAGLITVTDSLVPPRNELPAHLFPHQIY